MCSRITCLPNNLKVLERGPLRLVKVTFIRHLQGIYSLKGPFSCKGLIKVTFNSPFLNLKGPISKTLGIISRSACQGGGRYHSLFIYQITEFPLH